MKRVLIFIMLVPFVAFFFVFLILHSYTKDQGVFFPGVNIAGVDVSGLTQEEGISILEEKIAEKLSQELEFKLELTDTEAKSLRIKLAELGLSYSIEKSIEEAWGLGREGSTVKRALNKYKASKGYDIPLQVDWNEKVLAQELEESLQCFNSPPQDATVSVSSDNGDNQLKIIPEKIGLKADTNTLIKQITESDFSLAEALGTGEENTKTFEVAFERITPQITASLLKEEITELLAEYSTRFSPYEANRTQNIRLAAKTLDGKLLAPDEVFSFNDTVGERTAEAGYKDAMIIINNRFVPGLGGGICQVSSNLYNTVRRAELEVVERHPHSLPVNYVPPGMDATVAYSSLDFRFRNTTDSYLAICSLLENDTLTFQLYGKI